MCLFLFLWESPASTRFTFSSSSFLVVFSMLTFFFALFPSSLFSCFSLFSSFLLFFSFALFSSFLFSSFLFSSFFLFSLFSLLSSSASLSSPSFSPSSLASVPSLTSTHSLEWCRWAGIKHVFYWDPVAGEFACVKASTIDMGGGGDGYTTSDKKVILGQIRFALFCSSQRHWN
ncbi:hypothetical protein BDV98DRAFT_129459 [Pterulicium gracile]|uniref:Uncharacterized protein n=1 Tax=Pterulicium gracile TaxID=1884261 RepID=A0A5C3QHJ8_9AGAR|nr:hypothetical protein BDV98DRAFT_129459 [Pterula gracilis]